MEAYVGSELRRIGSSGIFLGAFGAAWLLWGLITAELATPATLGAAAVGAAAILIPATRFARISIAPPGPDDARRAHRFRRVNLAQYAAMAVAAVALMIAGRLDMLPAVISAIVALHFAALAHAFSRPLYYGTASALLGLDAGALGAGGDFGVLLALFGTGLILWATAAGQLATGFLLRARPA